MFPSDGAVFNGETWIARASDGRALSTWRRLEPDARQGFVPAIWCAACTVLEQLDQLVGTMAANTYNAKLPRSKYRHGAGTAWTCPLPPRSKARAH